MAKAFRGADAVQVEGLRQFSKELKKIQDDGGPQGLDLLKDANYRVAEFVVDAARPAFMRLNTQTKGQAAKVAATIRPARQQIRAVVALGNAKVPWAAGIEFGAYRDKRRLIKNTGGRATVVRDEERLGRVIRNVEAQRNINTGQQVQVTKQIRGWNQFLEWRGNKTGAGYALFPTVRERIDEIVDLYGDELDKIAEAAFPD